MAIDRKHAIRCEKFIQDLVNDESLRNYFELEDHQLTP